MALPGSPPWYRRLICDCPAGDKGYPACWHKALIWLILHQGVRYEERGPAVSQKSKQARTTRMIRQLRSLGYRIEPPNPHHPNPPQGQ